MRRLNIVLVFISLLFCIKGYSQNNIDILRFDISRFPSVKAVCLPYSKEAEPSAYLNEASYEITENGMHKPSGINIAPLSSRLPYNYIFAIDNSGSTKNFHNIIQKSINTILESIDPSDRVSLFLFDSSTEKKTDLVTDREIIRSIISDIKYDGNYTYIYDAMFEISNFIMSNRADMNIIIFFTDGIDTGSMVQPNTVIDKLTTDNIKFMNIGFGQDRRLSNLERLSGITGFESFRIKSAGESDKLGDFLKDRMNNQVMLSYNSSLKSIPDRDYFASVKFSSDGSNAVSSFSTGNILPIQNYILSLAEPEPKEIPKSKSSSSFFAGNNLIIAALILALGMIAYAFIRRQRQKTPATAAYYEPKEAQESVYDDYDEHTMVLEDIPDLTEEELEEEEFDDEILSNTIVMSEEPVIIIKQGSSRKITYDLGGKDNFTIGRAEGNSIVLANRSVSSKHCIIRKIGGAFVIYDLKSTNGTFVNGQRIKKALLKPGDTIHIGETILDFQLRRK